MGNRPEMYELKLLQLGLGQETRDIVVGMKLDGWTTNDSTISRLRTGSDVNIDVAGLPYYAIQGLFPTVSGVAVVAQTAVWLIRRALSEGWTGEELDEVFDAVEERIQQGENRFAQLKEPIDEETRDELALDLASIAEAKAQLEASRDDHLAAMHHFLEAYSKLLPVARRSGCHRGVIIVLGRSLAAALNEAFACDMADGRPIGKEPVRREWHLWKVIQRYRDPSPLRPLTEAVMRTGDDRMAANHADGFALAEEPRQAARMIQIGLTHAAKGATLETWQPPGRTVTVISEPYMSDAVGEYERLRTEDAKRKSAETSTSKGGIIKSVIVTVVAIVALTALTLAFHVTQAEAGPGRVTAVVLALNVG